MMTIGDIKFGRMSSVGTIRFFSALLEKVGRGEVGGCHQEGGSTWWLLQLAVETPWSMPGWPFFRFLAQMALKTLLSPVRGSILTFQAAEKCSLALINECSLMSRCGQHHELVKGMLWFKFPGLIHS